MRIALVTDAWHPQTNGVVRTLSVTVEQLRRLGHEVQVEEPSAYRTLPLPTYPEIRLAVNPGPRLAERLTAFRPDAVHVATEGTLGAAGRRWCRQRRQVFTTSYHTRFPEYLRARVPLPLAASYACLRRFHGAAARTMVATPTMRDELERRGFQGVALWSRGVDTELFRPRGKAALDLPRPIFLYFGRVAVEKGIDDFLRLDLPGSKVVVGDGPGLGALRAAWPGVHFRGFRFGVDLAEHVSAADVFVFPSRTDTFGLVLLEALACGVPVAAYPVTGPVDVVDHGRTGILGEDLRSAALAALHLDPAACRAQAERHTWEIATRQFLDNLVPVTG